MFFHCAAKKRLGGVYVPVPAEKEIHRLAGFVDGAVQVHPLAVDLYIGLVHPPRSVERPSVAPPALFEFRKVVLDPPQRGMGDGDPPVRHHDHQVPQAQFEARVPAYAQDDDLSVEVPSFEQIFDRGELYHLIIVARHPRVCTRAPSPSSVTISFALAADTGVTHERMALPPAMTVQAPHCASPQPNFGPSSRRSFRRT